GTWTGFSVTFAAGAPEPARTRCCAGTNPIAITASVRSPATERTQKRPAASVAAVLASSTITTRAPATGRPWKSRTSPQTWAGAAFSSSRDFENDSSPVLDAGDLAAAWSGSGASFDCIGTAVARLITVTGPPVVEGAGGGANRGWGTRYEGTGTSSPCSFRLTSCARPGAAAPPAAERLTAPAAARAGPAATEGACFSAP